MLTLRTNTYDKWNSVLYFVGKSNSMNKPLFSLLLFSFTFFNSIAQPANNTCATAVNLGTLTGDCISTAGTLYNAGSNNPTSSTCGNRADVWYRFTMPASSTIASITVTLTSSPSTLTTSNTYIELFNTNNCTVNGTSTGGCNNVSTARFYSGLTAGQTYYFRVNTTANITSGGTSAYGFSVCVASNDNCATATTLTPGSTFMNGTVFGASTSAGIPVGCATGNPDDDVWFKFTAVYNYATITLSNIGSSLASSGTRMQLFSGAACGSLTSLACGSDDVINATGLTAGNTYYIRVYSAGTGQAGFTSTNSGFRISLTPSSPVVVNSGRMKEVFSQQILSAPQVLADPWEVIYGPDGNLWVTEAKGYRLYKINPVTGVRDTVLDISQGSTFLPAADSSFLVLFSSSQNPWPQGGFAGAAIHPLFLHPTTPKNFVYVSYTRMYLGGSSPTGIFFKNYLVRFTYNTGTGKLGSPVALCDTLPGSSDHNSQRIIIAPVGGTHYLFYASGDMGAGQFGNKDRPNKAQNSNSYEGKILRFNLESDGDAGLNAWIPNDNPYSSTSAVWSIGIRNNQGFAYDSVLNILYGSSHGPFSDDEINIIQEGKNYGHPLVIGYAADNNANGTTAGAAPGMSPSHPSSCPVISNESSNAAAIGVSYKDPLFSAYPNSVAFPSLNTLWNTTTGANAQWPSEGWSGLDLYTHTVVPGWKQSLVAASLKWGRLMKLKLNNSGDVVIQTAGADTVSYFGSTNRFRDLAFAPNGKDMYVVMDRNPTSSGPSALNPIIPACGGCLQKYTFLGYADASGKSSIPTAIPVTAGILNSCTQGTTITIDNNNNNLWVPITGTDGNIMAEIKANGQNLGVITSSFYTNSGSIRQMGGKRYMDRNITITPAIQPSSPVAIRLYFSKSEFDALDNDPFSMVSSINDIKILKNNDACVGVVASTTSVINPLYAEAHGSDGYMVQANISSFSSFYFGSQGMTLPLQLLYFRGNLQGNTVYLNWETSNEINTSHFNIERSTDGSSFESIATVAAIGNNNIAKYSSNDNDVLNKSTTVFYYRLKMFDNDGSFKYSNIVTIALPDITGKLIIYPNPAKSVVNVSITTTTTGPVTLKLINNTGRVVMTQMYHLMKGKNDFSVNVDNLSSGVYYFMMTGEAVSDQKVKFQKL